jgi:small subunit ribosomal protein S1
VENNQISAPTTTPASPTLATPAPEENDIVTATVVRLSTNAAVVAIAGGLEGSVAFSEFDEVDGKPAVKVGDQFEVLVESLEADPVRGVPLSKDKARRLRTWDAVMARCAAGGPVEGTIVARIPGGFTVDIGIPAFLPNSQSGTKRTDDPDGLVGQSFTFGISEFDAHRPKIVLTRRALAEQEHKARKQQVLSRIVEGAVLTGTVKTVADYGAFVDLGGIDGLVHVSQMRWTHIDHPREMVKVGDEVKVKVLKHDSATGKISLGMKQLQEDPWANVETRFPVGSTIEGKVTGFADFGAFVALAPGVEGLIHVSEMSWTRKIKNPADELEVEETVRAVVLQVDPEARRISLGLRQLQPNPWKVLAEKYPVGSKVHGKVRGITDFGLFVELEEGIEGLVHIGELTWTGKVSHPGDLYKIGDEVDAQVLKVDIEDHRLSLGIKQLQPSPWQALEKEHPVGSRFKGRVARIADFGAFVEVMPGIEGLVHVSELSEEHVDRVGDAVRIGQEIEVQVMEIDAAHRKVSLSVKALTQVSAEEYREHLKQPNVKTTLGDVFADKLKKK